MASRKHERLVEHALALIVQVEGARPEAAAQAGRSLASWRQASSEHEAAARDAHQRWNALFALSPGLRAHFDEPPPVAPARARRRAVLSAVALLGGGLLSGGLGWRWWVQRPLYEARYQTGTGELSQVALDDGTPGSRLVLAPDSRLDVALYRERRVVSLSHGEVHCDVAPDAGRPFQVRTKDAIVEVVGTAFTVRDRGGPVAVTVEHGRVRVHMLTPPAGAGDDRHEADAPALYVLEAGDMLTTQEGRATVRRVDVAGLAAWRQGWLVFDDTPLGEALDTINAYRREPIEVADASVKSLRLSGRFRGDDMAGLLRSLPLALPVRVAQSADGRVTLHAAKSP